MMTRKLDQNHNKTQLKIGEYEIIPIPTGLFGLDGGAMFGTVPKALWSKTNPADDHNRIQMEARALLLKSSKNGNTLSQVLRLKSTGNNSRCMSVGVIVLMLQI